LVVAIALREIAIQTKKARPDIFERIDTASSASEGEEDIDYDIEETNEQAAPEKDYELNNDIPIQAGVQSDDGGANFAEPKDTLLTNSKGDLINNIDLGN
jgi:hypothetical protein